MKKSDKVVLLDIDYTMFKTAEFKESNLTKYELYEEVQDAVLKLKDIAVLGVFSEGDLELQRKKLTKTGIFDHFIEEHTHIIQRKRDVIEELLKRYKRGKLIIVDDKWSILHLAKEYMPSVITIWVKRGFYAEQQKPTHDFSPDVIVDDLQDLPSLINGL